MIAPYKNREIHKGMLVQIYRNLHTGNFSIRNKQTGLVVAHGNNLLMKDPKFIVNDKGRKRVINEQVKNVHAYIEGIYCGTTNNQCTKHLNEIYYNPYTTNQFKIGTTNAKDMNVKSIIFSNNKVYCLTYNEETT